jgi:hypothetical protein
MTNFGILMEINGIKDPFKWSRDVVNKLQSAGTGLYYSVQITLVNPPQPLKVME